MEIWKDIKGYKGLYQASSLGRFMSLRFGKIICPSYPHKNSNGVLGLRNRKGVNKSFIPSRIIAELFVQNPDGHEVVRCRHNKRYLHPSNWFWTTYSETIKEGARFRTHIVRKLTCQNKGCGKTFIVERSNMKRPYCSQKCSGETFWRRLGKKGRLRHENHNKKKVVAIKGKKRTRFNSVNEAARHFKVSPSTISNVLAGRSKGTTGHKFKFL